MEILDLEVFNNHILLNTTEDNDRKVKEFIEKYPDKMMITDQAKVNQEITDFLIKCLILKVNDDKIKHFSR